MIIASLIANAAVALTASVTPTYAFGSRTGAGSVTTSSVTVTPVGGVAPYTYSWAMFSGDTFTFTAGTSATTAFVITVGIGDEKSGVARCTVTSSDSQNTTVDVDVSALEVSYF